MLIKISICDIAYLFCHAFYLAELPGTMMVCAKSSLSLLVNRG